MGIHGSIQWNSRNYTYLYFLIFSMKTNLENVISIEKAAVMFMKNGF